MSLLAFHFSEFHKEKILSGKKRHTIVDYPLYLNPGQKILIYISKSKKVENSIQAERIGVALIEKVIVVRVSDITDEVAQSMGKKNRADLLSSLTKWYDITDNSVITYLGFKFEANN